LLDFSPENLEGLGLPFVFQRFRCRISAPLPPPAEFSSPWPLSVFYFGPPDLFCYFASVGPMRPLVTFETHRFLLCSLPNTSLARGCPFMRRGDFSALIPSRAPSLFALRLWYPLFLRFFPLTASTRSSVHCLSGFTAAACVLKQNCSGPISPSLDNAPFSAAWFLQLGIPSFCILLCRSRLMEFFRQFCVWRYSWFAPRTLPDARFSPSRRHPHAVFFFRDSGTPRLVDSTHCFPPLK